MAASFFFYDLETSGRNRREDRVMQFAGQRTDMELRPVGEPVNVLIKLTADVVPQPDAVLLTGITPQRTLSEGISEIEFLQLFHREVVRPETIFVGYNSVRFDDEFMRFLHYRNFYDAYAWEWCDDCSRWDLLDVARMTRALRPEGINWPVEDDGTPGGKPTNRLELLTKLNGLDHEQAHDALSDVQALIGLARLIRGTQPGLFEYLLGCRGKKPCKQRIDTFVAAKQPFLYTSGRYSGEYLHTTAVKLLAHHVGQQYGYVYDLRVDPTPFLAMDAAQLMEHYNARRDSGRQPLPIKLIRYNRCPAIAPISILGDGQVQERLKLPLETVQANLRKLAAQRDFAVRVIEAVERAIASRPFDDRPLGESQAVDSQLYDSGFFSQQDKAAMERVRIASPDDCQQLDVAFQDPRLQALFPLFKARNYSTCLSDDDRRSWEEFCRQRLINGGPNGRLGRYFKRLEELAGEPDLTPERRYLLEELQLYGESIMPA